MSAAHGNDSSVSSLNLSEVWNVNTFNDYKTVVRFMFRSPSAAMPFPAVAPRKKKLSVPISSFVRCLLPWRRRRRYRSRRRQTATAADEARTIPAVRRRQRWSSEREIEREPEIHSAQTLEGTCPLEAATEQFSLMLMLKRELGLTLSLKGGLLCNSSILRQCIARTRSGKDQFRPCWRASPYQMNMHACGAMRREAMIQHKRVMHFLISCLEIFSATRNMKNDQW